MDDKTAEAMSTLRNSPDLADVEAGELLAARIAELESQLLQMKRERDWATEDARVSKLEEVRLGVHLRGLGLGLRFSTNERYSAYVKVTSLGGFLC